MTYRNRRVAPAQGRHIGGIGIGIGIVIAAEQPEGVPEENWLPINRADMDLDIIMRLYAPDLERYESWTAPKAKKL